MLKKVVLNLDGKYRSEHRKRTMLQSTESVDCSIVRTDGIFPILYTDFMFRSSGASKFDIV